MTNFGKKNTTCSKCKKKCQVEVLVSTNSFGSPDLDCRPPPMERNTMEAWIEHCPNCHYCAKDISQENEVSNEFLQSNEYLDLFKGNSSQYSSLAKEFLAAALCMKSINCMKDAAIFYHHASWICDDNNGQDSKESKECRQKSLELFQIIHNQSERVHNDDFYDESIMCDLYRRNEQYDECRQLCERTLTKNPSGIFSQLLQYQIKLCEQKDHDVHEICDIE
ncbi:hypothetical protein TRFO_08788 [Tritrichomonas foetus]|uniref:Uncharacterized protein n=1 Tax=Tritrichomonas foetus TaxID=1144522 RepID=A0A1J4JJK9_9EUKA|nr:hypothetical protein TRFO_08788 [Tritrichomonas foetus]|eukprot:OHS98527.1 hypothetical protein TRFO_08788 [Tritrichomonas foetus]